MYSKGFLLVLRVVSVGSMRRGPEHKVSSFSCRIPWARSDLTLSASDCGSDMIRNIQNGWRASEVAVHDAIEPLSYLVSLWTLMMLSIERYASGADEAYFDKKWSCQQGHDVSNRQARR
jgi:hypothetical protein